MFGDAVTNTAIFPVIACFPEWFVQERDCPYGRASNVPLANFTWPKDHSSWVAYIAAFYSLMPLLVGVGPALAFVWTRGTRELLAVVFFVFYVAPVVFIMKHIVADRRPEGSCLVSCGMPSGHALDCVSFLTWCALEIAFSKTVNPTRKICYVTALLAVFLPVGWSRIVLRDHSLRQVLVGTVIGALMGTSWYLFLCQRFCLWTIKAVEAQVACLCSNYPLDTPLVEIPWCVTQNAELEKSAPVKNPRFSEAPSYGSAP